jgi:predicted nucleotidyltransferase
MGENLTTVSRRISRQGTWGMQAVERLPEIIDRWVRQFHPLRIVLFGSQAREDARSDSDIDLLVVLPEVKDKRKTLVALLRAVGDLSVPVDVIPTDPDEIRRRGNLAGSVLRAALKEGKVVYDRP